MSITKEPVKAASDKKPAEAVAETFHPDPWPAAPDVDLTATDECSATGDEDTTSNLDDATARMAWASIQAQADFLNS